MIVDDVLADAVASFATARGAHGERDADFAGRTTYRVGGRARVLVETSDPVSLCGIGEVVGDDVPLVVIGNGSNVLVADAGFDGVVIVATPGQSEDVVFDAHDSAQCDVTVAGSLRLPVLARQCVAAGWCGLEWAVGVPGSVGGAVKMNAGGHGSDMSSSLVRVDIANLRTGARRVVQRDDIGLRFRGSALNDDHVVLFATLKVHAPAGHDCAGELASIVSWRRENQPGGHNAGSVFVNPGVGERSAGALIDACGLRGRRIGSAEVSSKHANFIQADAGGSADDVVALMVLVQDEVRRVHGVAMRSEIRLLGFPAELQERFHDPLRNDVAVREAEARLRALV